MLEIEAKIIRISRKRTNLRLERAGLLEREREGESCFGERAGNGEIRRGQARSERVAWVGEKLKIFNRRDGNENPGLGGILNSSRHVSDPCDRLPFAPLFLLYAKIPRLCSPALALSHISTSGSIYTVQTRVLSSSYQNHQKS
ncbi:hypothetical protein ACLOJK_002423 [Asimina triloba]